MQRKENIRIASENDGLIESYEQLQKLKQSILNDRVESIDLQDDAVCLKFVSIEQ